MTRVVVLLWIVLVGILTGCQNSASSKKNETTINPGVLDVAASPAPIPSEQPVAAQPVMVQPISDVQTASYASSTPSVPTTTTRKTYTIKKGDTLFSIAKANYGSGKEWQKIAAANPGLEPSKLKVGQQIVIP